ncbi:MAG: hypothetical protein HKN13_03220, partial [Rhodothermales bacterium]|nr:hypothetical protein [Rhodothermales bacterium]
GGLYLADTITSKVFDYFTITTRNFVHPLTDQPTLPGSNVRPILDADPATDIAVNMTYPAYAGLSIDIVDTIPGPAGAVDRPTYIVEISREQSDFLDLAVTPWNAPPWESPDIWIEHGDKAEADLSTVPLPENGEPARWSDTYDPNAPGNDGKPLNWIRVKVTNNGTVDATDVELKVKVNSPGGMGGKGDWVELDLSEPADIPAGGSTIISVPWNPKVRGHTCIQVEIFRWSSALGDIDLTNNGTQENVNSFRPTAGSPWHPAPFSVDVANPFDRALEIYLQADGLRPGFSVAWDEAFFVMEPHSKTTRTGVLHIDEDIVPTPEPDGSGGIVFYEYQCGPDIEVTAAALKDRRCDKVRTKPIRMYMHVAGYANAGDFRVPIGGVTYNVQPTLRLDLDVRVTGRGGDIHVEGETSPKAGGQDMEIELQYPSGRFDWVPVRTDGDGRFDVSIRPEEEGTVGVAVNYPDGGAFAPVKVEGKLYDPNIPAGFFTCVSCETQAFFWILNLLLLVLILLFVIWIWHAMRKASKAV